MPKPMASPQPRYFLDLNLAIRKDGQPWVYLHRHSSVPYGEVRKTAELLVAALNANDRARPEWLEREE